MYPAPPVRPGGRSRRARLLAAWAASSLAAPILIGTAFPDAGAATPDGDGVVQPEAAPSESEFFTDLDAGSHTITLITGDRVTINVSDGGLTSVDAELAPRPDGSIPDINIPFTGGEGLYAYPEDVWPYIDAGLLDDELFNIEYLAANGYTDEDSDQLPVIVEYADQVRTASATRNAESMPASKRTVTLESLNAAGVTVDKGDTEVFWESLTSEQPADELSSQTAKLPAGIEKVWLDRKAEVVLDESVPQIGAPDAWDAGFDGTGVTVAVLDTGIDANHPDVAGKVVASQSFIDGEEVADGHGHGTHVAATVAGSGDASDGLRPGVAPGAELVVGKVLNNAGSGTDSQVIAGMEWATLEQEADVVSMSLGGGPTDGTDPMSQAVNQLTDTTGALFVIAAGNDGPGDSTVTTPGAADAALTIGAVDKADHLASFSGRGPRVGDYAIKPEITAPGVAIVAARADGTSMGTPVDDLYTSANGTSMATPHVAGAVAILAQQHPNWDAAQLKAALVASAEDGGYSVYEQGAGRVDVAHAVRQQLQVSPATADFGLIPFGQEEPPAPQTLTYTNPTDEPVTLDLAATASTEDGTPVPDGVLTLDQDTLTVPATGAADVTVTLHPTGLDASLYTGRVTATRAEGLHLTTPVGFAVDEEKFPLRIRLTYSEDQHGFSPGSSGVQVSITAVDGAEWSERIFLTRWEDPLEPYTAEVRLPAGTYDISAQNAAWNDLTTGQRQTALLVAPEVRVPDEAEVVLDASQAERITFDTPEPYAAEGILGETSFSQVYLHVGRDGLRAGGATIAAHPQRWVTPTDDVSTGTLRYEPRMGLAAPAVTMEALGPDGRSLHVIYAVTGWSRRSTGDPWGPGQRFSGKDNLPLVDVGSGTPEELDGLDVSGKLVLLNRNPADPPDGVGATACWPLVDAVERVTVEDPAGIIMVQNEHSQPGHDHGTQNPCPLPSTQEYQISVPLVFAPFGDGEHLREMLADGDVDIRVQGTPVTPYFYDLKPHEQGRSIPAPHYDVRNDLAVLDHAHHLTNPFLTAASWRRDPENFLISYGGQVALHGGQVFGSMPRHITHYVGPVDPDVVWRLWDRGAGESGPRLTQEIYYVFDDATRMRIGWYDSPPVPQALPPLPSVPTNWPEENPLPCTGCRQGDTFWPAPIPYSRASSPAYGQVVPRDFPIADLHLYRDGKEIDQTAYDFNAPGWPFPFSYAGYQLPPEPAQYRLTHELGGTETAWEFTSESVPVDETPGRYECLGTVLASFGAFPPNTPCRPEPLIFLRYDLGLDLSNQVQAPSSHAFGVTAYRQPSEAAMPEIEGLEVSVSYDGGEEWTEARVGPLGDGQFDVRVTHPPSRRRASDTVSIRALAWDANGNRVEQTIEDAFRLTGNASHGGGKPAAGGDDLVS